LNWDPVPGDYDFLGALSVVENRKARLNGNPSPGLWRAGTAALGNAHAVKQDKHLAGFALANDLDGTLRL
jgi:hypothetical protein